MNLYNRMQNSPGFKRQTTRPQINFLLIGAGSDLLEVFRG